MSNDEAWALAIHEALREHSDDAGFELSSGRIDGPNGEPGSGWIDGDVVVLARVLQAAGWTPPAGVVERWRGDS